MFSRLARERDHAVDTAQARSVPARLRSRPAAPGERQHAPCFLGLRGPRSLPAAPSHRLAIAEPGSRPTAIRLAHARYSASPMIFAEFDDVRRAVSIASGSPRTASVDPWRSTRGRLRTCPDCVARATACSISRRRVRHRLATNCLREVGRCESAQRRTKAELGLAIPTGVANLQRLLELRSRPQRDRPGSSRTQTQADVCSGRI